MNQMTAGSQQQTALNNFNAVCCFCVVLVHALSPGITQADPRSWQMAAIYFPWLAARFSVAGFLFVSGIKMGLSSTSFRAAPYPIYIKHRMQRVLIPYLLWTFIYYICFSSIGYADGTPSELFYFLWSGTLSAQFSRPAWDFFYQASLFVFFSHCLVLTLGTFALHKAGVTRLFFLLSFRLLLGFLLPLLLYRLATVLLLKTKRIL